MSKPRVLVLAQDANPEWVSVPLLGWSHSRAIAELVDAHVVTQVRNRDAFKRAGLVEGRDFTVIDSEAVAALAYRLSRAVRRDNTSWTTNTALMGLSYYYFEHLVWRELGDDIRRGRFDVVHRLKPQSPTVPSLLAARCRQANVPFVLGPLAGGLPWPKQFRDTQHAEREWLAYVRGMSRLLPSYRATREYASAIMVASRAVLEEMPRRYHDKCVYVPENSVDETRFRPRPHPRFELPLSVLFVGRLVPYKGADMLIDACKDFVRSGSLTLTIVGDGPERPKLERLVTDFGIARGVQLVGNVAQADLPRYMGDAHVFGFPSVREFGGAVVLEAMAMGVVPAVVDYGGPAELVSDDSGYKIPLSTRAEIIASFRRLFERLLRDPTELRDKSLRAQERVRRRFTWRAKAEQTVAVYDWVLGRAQKPNFEMPFV